MVKHVALSIWLLSPCTTVSRFTHTVVHVSVLPSFSWLCHIPLDGETTFCLLLHLLMDIWVVSCSGHCEQRCCELIPLWFPSQLRILVSESDHYTGTRDGMWWGAKTTVSFVGGQVGNCVSHFKCASSQLPIPLLGVDSTPDPFAHGHKDINRRH